MIVTQTKKKKKKYIWFHGIHSQRDVMNKRETRKIKACILL